MSENDIQYINYVKDGTMMLLNKNEEDFVFKVLDNQNSARKIFRDADKSKQSWKGNLKNIHNLQHKLSITETGIYEDSWPAAYSYSSKRIARQSATSFINLLKDRNAKPKSKYNYKTSIYDDVTQKTCTLAVRFNSNASKYMHNYILNNQLDNLQCACCGIAAKYVYFELAYDVDGPPLPKFYAVEVDGEEILLTIDHILALHNGGADEFYNYQVLCFHCNQIKGHLSNEKFLLIAEKKLKEKYGRTIIKNPLAEPTTSWNISLILYSTLVRAMQELRTSCRKVFRSKSKSEGI